MVQVHGAHRAAEAVPAYDAHHHIDREIEEERTAHHQARAASWRVNTLQRALALPKGEAHRVL